MSNYLHENERYYVEVVERDFYSSQNDYEVGYGLFNKATGVMEYITASLPEAIFNAEQFDVTLENRTWEWIRSRGGALPMDFDETQVN